MELLELKENEFTTFVLDHHYDNYLQRVEFAKLKEKEGWKSYLLGGTVNNELVAATLIITYPSFLGYTLCLAPNGFLLDYHNAEHVKDFTHLVRDFLKKEKGLYLRIDPKVLYQQHDQNGDIVEGGFNNQICVDNICHAGFKHEGFIKGLDPSFHPRFSFVTPLENETKESLLKKMSKLTQRSIKNTEKYLVRVEKIEDKKGLDEYCNIIYKTADRRHFSPLDKTYYHDQWDFYDRDTLYFLKARFYVKEYLDSLNDQLICEEKKLKTYTLDNLTEKQLKKKNQQEEIVANLKKNILDAAAILEESGEVVTLSVASFFILQDEILYFNGGSEKKYMKYCGQYALQWYMIQKGLEKGLKRHNFYGLSGIFDESAEDYGVFTFKRGFGGFIEENIGYFSIAIHPSLFKIYTLCRKLKHLLRH